MKVKFAIVKRVVAIAGDTVELRKKALKVNEKIVNEPYAVYKNEGIKDFGPVTVPDGSLFVLGDNRDQSRDSRWWPASFLEVSRLTGRVLYIYWSNRSDWSRIGKRL